MDLLEGPWRLERLEELPVLHAVWETPCELEVSLRWMSLDNLES